MSNVEQTLISIYDAAIDQSRWQEALDQIMASVGSDAASLQMVPTETGNQVGAQPFVLEVLSGQLASLDPGVLEHYLQHHSVLEADAWEHLRDLPPGTILTDEDFYHDMQAIRSRPDYEYLINHMGLFRRIASRLNDNRTWFDAIAFQWHRDVMEIPSQSIERAEILLPHISKAFRLSRGSQQLLERYQAVIGALDQVQIGVCIADQSGHLVFSNLEARRILEMGDGIQFNSAGRLSVSDAGRDALLNAAIDQIALTAAGKGLLSGETLLVDRLSGGHPFLVDVTPVRDTLGEIRKDFSGAMITIIDPENHQPFQTKRVALAYGLSDAEVEVCRFVVEGRSNQAIADERNVSLDTIKTQVKSIMNKTATKRRADLIRLVVRTAPPINLNDPPEEGCAEG